MFSEVSWHFVLVAGVGITEPTFMKISVQTSKGPLKKNVAVLGRNKNNGCVHFIKKRKMHLFGDWNCTGNTVK